MLHILLYLFASEMESARECKKPFFFTLRVSFFHHRLQYLCWCWSLMDIEFIYKYCRVCAHPFLYVQSTREMFPCGIRCVPPRQTNKFLRMKFWNSIFSILALCTYIWAQQEKRKILRQTTTTTNSTKLCSQQSKENRKSLKHFICLQKRKRKIKSK